jgi:hypothetical protein
MPYFGTTIFAAPGLGIIASFITMAFGMWWLGRAEAVARKAGDVYVGGAGGCSRHRREDSRAGDSAN